MTLYFYNNNLTNASENQTLLKPQTQCINFGGKILTMTRATFLSLSCTFILKSDISWNLFPYQDIATCIYPVIRVS